MIAAAIAGAAIWLLSPAPLQQRHLLMLKTWALAFSALAPIYFSFFWAAHFYPRYCAPLAIIGCVWFGVFAGRLMARAIAALALALLLVNAGVAWRELHTGRMGEGHAVTAGFVNRYLSGQKVGAFQSGVTGYYNENVVNLDGKVNVAALRAMRERRVEQYLDEAGIDFVVDWRGVIEGLLPGALASGRWSICPADVGARETICIMRAGLSFPVSVPG
jgi:hypothetical protein